MSNNSCHILFFDGVCGLCNKAVDFSMRWKKDENLKFAPLQGETAKKLLPGHFISEMNSLVLWTNDGIYTESDAALRLAGHLRAPWSWGKIGFIFPRFLRNLIYRIIAKNRYWLFGKKETCRLPSLAEKEQFLP